MCQTASMVVAHDGDGSLRVYSDLSDSHEQIIKTHGLTWIPARPNLTWVEITPPNGDHRIPLTKWEYRIDSTNKAPVPDCREAEVEAACRKHLRVVWSKAHIVWCGTHNFSGRISLIVLGGHVRITGLTDSAVWAYRNSRITTINQVGGIVGAFDNSRITTIDQAGGDVWACNNSRITIIGQTGGDVWACNNSRITTIGQTGWAFNNIRITPIVQTGEDIWACNNSPITYTNYKGGVMRVYGKAQLICQ